MFGIRTVLPFLLFALLSGCETPPLPQTQDSPVKTVKRNDYLVVARFLDEGTLKARYGARHNPFIAVQRLATPRRFLVFKLNFQQVTRKIVVRTGELEFQLGGTHTGPLNEFHLLQYWEQEDESGDILPQEKDIRDATIKSEVLPRQLKIPAGGGFSGLVVFSANFPRYGKGTLYVPILDENERLIERLELTFEF